VISKKTKYGLQALTYIARHQSEFGVIPISQIIEYEKMSKKFLESILLILRKSGYLGSKRGKGGGYYLLKNATDIVICDVIRVLEGPIAMLPCVSLNYYEECKECPDEATCGLHKLLIKVRDNTLNIFKNHTLQDLI